MADANLTLFTDLLVEDYEPSVKDQLEHEVFINKFMEKNANVKKLDNFNYSLPVRKGRTSGNYGVSESNNNVVHGSPTYDKSILTAKTLTTAFKITHQALAVNPDGSVDPLFNQIMGDVAKDYVHWRNWMTFSSGAKIGDAAAEEAVGDTSFVFADSTNDDIDYAAYAPVGSYIKIGSNDAVQVTAVTDINTITISASQTWAAGDDVVLVNQTGASSTTSTVTSGFPDIFGVGDFQGIDGTTNSFWRAHRVNHGAVLGTTERPLNRLITARNKFGQVDFLVTNASLYSDVGTILTSLKRTVNDLELTGGWSGLELMGGQTKLILDFDCPDDKFYGGDSSALTVAQLEDFHWLKDGGQAIHRIDGSLNYEVVGVEIAEIACSRRNALLELYGVQKNA